MLCCELDKQSKFDCKTCVINCTKRLNQHNNLCAIQTRPPNLHRYTIYINLHKEPHDYTPKRGNKFSPPVLHLNERLIDLSKDKTNIFWKKKLHLWGVKSITLRKCREFNEVCG